MRRGTTPVVEIGLDCDISGCEYYVTFSCNGRTVTKGAGDCGLSDDGRTVLVPLGQEDTLAFTAGYPLRVQVRFKDADGMAYATDVARAAVEEVLLEEVI